MRARILIADTPTGLKRLREVLSAYELLEVTTLQQAMRLIVEDGIDLVVVGLQFDDSRAIELLKAVRAGKQHQLTPFVIIKDTRSQFDLVLKQSIEALTKIYNISAYIEFEGVEEHKILREKIEQCLPETKRIQVGRINGTANQE